MPTRDTELVAATDPLTRSVTRARDAVGRSLDIPKHALAVDCVICSVDGAARILGVGVGRMRQLDKELRPAFVRRGNHKMRIYRVSDVERFAAHRDALEAKVRATRLQARALRALRRLQRVGG